MKALIIGLGLIGGSLAKAFKKYQIASEIAVFDPNTASCKQAMADGVANEIYYDLSNKEELSQYQIIVIACPLGAFANIAPLVFNNASETALIFDVCSLKNFAELDFKSIHPNFNPSTFANLPQNFIPAHPIAGSHLTGYQNSDADLFVGKDFVVCLNKNPTKLQQKFAEQLRQIITKIGSKPIELDPKKHDRIYALVSHLPQYLSFFHFSLTLPDKSIKTNIFQIATKQLSFSYLKQCFRLNYSNRDLWKEIILLNAKNLESFYEDWKKQFCFILHNLITSSNPYNYIIQCITKNYSNDFKEEEKNEIKRIINIEDDLEIILRLISVITYLTISKIDDFQQYAGKGFADFTSIVRIISIIEEQTFNDCVRGQHYFFSENHIILDAINRELPKITFNKSIELIFKVIL